MKRIETHTILIKRKAFQNREAFLKFVYSPYPNIMSTYYPSNRREFTYAVILFLYIVPLPCLTQNLQVDTDFEKYLQQAQQDTFSLEARKRFLRIAHTTQKFPATDSITYSRLSKIVEIASHLNDSVLFHEFAKEALTLAKTLNNPEHLGDAHWNYGSYYERRKKYDSSYVNYNTAYKYFVAANNEYYAAKMLYNMGYIAGQTYDYTGAEILLFRSIKIFERYNKQLQLYRCYNKLGNHADDMEEFDKSLVYYKKASTFIPNLQNKEYYQLEHWNNMGVRLYKMELFTEAIPYFKKALAHKDLLKTKPALYAKLLDNLAFCQVSLRNYQNVLDPMRYALALRDSIGDNSGMVTSRLRFAYYYGKQGDTLTAIVQAKLGLKLAKENHFTPEVLHALEMLGGLDKNNAVSYLEQYLHLNKSLNARDRNLRNKFTAIQFETDKYIAENEKLFRQRLWISIAAITLIIFVLLIYWNARQRSRNKALLFEREQQQYNEDLFLMKLKQKTNLEKGKSEERLRISQELHDNIVSRLFTLRFRWLSVSLTGEAQMISLHRHFLELLEELEFDIRNLSYDLKKVVFFWEEKYLEILENILKEKKAIGGFDTYFECTNPGDWEQLSPLTKINLQRIFEEVLQNIAKHAQAKMVNVIMNRELGNLELSIRDNGKGMNLSKIRKGLGMKSLENRTEKLQGKIEVISSPGSGTTIKLQIPFKLNIE
jgi:signal transduction histidine kinase